MRRMSLLVCLPLVAVIACGTTEEPMSEASDATTNLDAPITVDTERPPAGNVDGADTEEEETEESDIETDTETDTDAG